MNDSLHVQYNVADLPRRLQCIIQIDHMPCNETIRDGMDLFSQYMLFLI